jgi:hypothetical protein
MESRTHYEYAKWGHSAEKLVPGDDKARTFTPTDLFIIHSRITSKNAFARTPNFHIGVDNPAYFPPNHLSLYPPSTACPIWLHFANAEISS